MKLAVFGKSIFTEQIKLIAGNNDCQIVDDVTHLLAIRADVFFTDEATSIPANGSIPVFFNAVSQTLSSLPNTQHIIRFNGWNGFIEKPLWETAGEITPAAASILKTLQKEALPCADEPGFISARTIAMIINEAYFAWEENVSTKEEIDTAMKLGTNYPWGPFEWAKKIGLDEVAALLTKLSVNDERYRPSKMLMEELNQ